MLDHLQGRVSDRKLRLFAVACCRRVPHWLTKRRSQKAVDVAERFADGIATSEDLEEAGTRMRVREIRGHYGPVAAWAVAPSADLAARNAAWNAFVDRNDGVENLAQAGLLRCIFGNPFRPVTISEDWLTPTVLALAQGIYEDGAFDRLPILGDALEDAGCNNAEVMNHCRGPGPHVKGCWVVDALLDKT
jgi:hypothetical protein